jgi:hypothetical protein
MFFREFTVLKVKREARQTWEFPVSIDECAESPLAGAFDEPTLKKLDRAVGGLEFAQRTHDGRRAWSVAARRGALDVWLTSDGSVFVEGVTSLNVVYALFLQLLDVCRDLVIEDRITGELHDRASRSEERRVGKECRRLCRSRWSPYH